ncbi:hypothetical protein MRX96_030583 [Rhipicephalus microplus]
MPVESKPTSPSATKRRSKHGTVHGSSQASKKTGVLLKDQEDPALKALEERNQAGRLITTAPPVGQTEDPYCKELSKSGEAVNQEA